MRVILGGGNESLAGFSGGSAASFIFIEYVSYLNYLII
jgi:hypothetical protein